MPPKTPGPAGGKSSMTSPRTKQSSGSTSPRATTAARQPPSSAKAGSASTDRAGSPQRTSTSRSTKTPASKKSQAAVKQELLEKAKGRTIAADLLERLLKARFARDEVIRVLDEQREKAATVIESVWRMHRAKMRVRAYQTPGHPRFATRIQKVVRGMLARKRVKLGFVPKWEAAATYIQRLYRGSVTRVMSKQLKLLRALVAALALAGMTVDIELGHFRRLEERERDASTPITEQIRTAFTVARNFPSVKAHMLRTMFTGLDSSGEGTARFKDLLRVGRTIDLDASLLQYCFRFFGKTDEVVLRFEELCEGFEKATELFAGKFVDGKAGADLGEGAEATEMLREKKEKLDAYIATVEEDIGQLKRITASKRARAYTLLDKKRRIRIARRIDRGLLQEAILYMDHQQSQEVRKELSMLQDSEDEEAALQEAVAMQEEQTHAKVYLATRSPTSSPAVARRGLHPHPFPPPPTAVDTSAANATAPEHAPHEVRAAGPQATEGRWKTGGAEQAGARAWWAEGGMGASWSLFRVVRHPLEQREEERQQARRELLRELRCTVREGEGLVDEGETLLWQGRLVEAERSIREGFACLEYADGLERESRLVLGVEHKLALLYEGAEPTPRGVRGERVLGLLNQIQLVDADLRRQSWPLHEASARGQLGTVKYLVEKGGERVDGVDGRGWTALHAAAGAGQTEMVRLLVAEMGARVGPKSLAGRTPMDVAAERGHAAAMWELFESSAERILKEDKARVLKRGELRLTRVGGAKEALTQLGVGGPTAFGNATLHLAANRGWSEPLVILAEATGMAEGRKSARAADPLAKMNKGQEGEEGEEPEPESAEEVDRRLEAEMRSKAREGYDALRKAAPFAPGLHGGGDSRESGERLRAELHIKYLEDGDLYRERAGMEARPISASSGGSRPSTGVSLGSAASGRSGKPEAAMLRGNFSLRVQVQWGRELRERVGVDGGAPLPILSAWHDGSKVAAARALAPSVEPQWDIDVELKVKPDEESDMWRWLELVVSDVDKPWFMGVSELDLGDIPFGVTEGWYALKDSSKWRGEELNPRNRLRLGRIRPIAPVEGELYITMTASNPVQHLPAPPPQSAMELYRREHVGDLLQRSRGLGRRRRAAVLAEMWAELERTQPAAAREYRERADTLREEHVGVVEGHLLQFCSAGGAEAVAAVQYCLKQGSSPNATNQRGNSALLVAAHRGHESVVELLLAKSANVAFKTSEGSTPLYHAGVRGHVAVVEMLLGARADVDAKTKNGSTTLMTAAHLGQSEVLEKLIAARADVNATNMMGATALHLAAFGRQPHCVQVLLGADADQTVAIAKGNLRGMLPKEVARDPQSIELLGGRGTVLLDTITDSLARFTGTLPRPASP